jgi:hypothetical protein
LYAHLARDLRLADRMRLGYVCLDQSTAPVGAKLAGWSDADIAEALDVARDVARRVRAGEHFELGRLPKDPLVLALAGRGLVGAGAAVGPEGADGADDGAANGAEGEADE